ncbi:hypothetical protein GBF38_012335 [Nibea albiflora]|uniref:Uncharacterized protein n=1 Tax=Nibea albiflora TaxID=240163 RepID=A0ACB7EII8_NIBAL|nr:hypothetical protein GBF38_012335 [Nibea albiflora]
MKHGLSLLRDTSAGQSHPCCALSLQNLVVSSYLLSLERERLRRLDLRLRLLVTLLPEDEDEDEEEEDERRRCFLFLLLRLSSSLSEERRPILTDSWHDTHKKAHSTLLYVSYQHMLY